MARTWAQILSAAIEERGSKPAIVAKETGRFPGGPIQRMTVGRQAKGESAPTAKSLRLLCAVLDLDEQAVRREIEWAPIHGPVFEGSEDSKTLTPGQRDTVSRVISEMVTLNQLLAKNGISPDESPADPG